MVFYTHWGNVSGTRRSGASCLVEMHRRELCIVAKEELPFHSIFVSWGWKEENSLCDVGNVNEMVQGRGDSDSVLLATLRVLA